MAVTSGSSARAVGADVGLGIASPAARPSRAKATQDAVYMMNCRPAPQESRLIRAATAEINEGVSSGGIIWLGREAGMKQWLGTTSPRRLYFRRCAITKCE
jgi:hypothetical protein